MMQVAFLTANLVATLSVMTVNKNGRGKALETKGVFRPKSCDSGSTFVGQSLYQNQRDNSSSRRSIITSHFSRLTFRKLLYKILLHMLGESTQTKHQLRKILSEFEDGENVREFMIQQQLT